MRRRDRYDTDRTIPRYDERMVVRLPPGKARQIAELNDGETARRSVDFSRPLENLTHRIEVIEETPRDQIIERLQRQLRGGGLR